MRDGSKFIGNHPTTSYHQHIFDGTANSVYRNKVKVRRTHGWRCRFDGYKSNKHYNVQRHINSVHGRGSGVPVDCITGETREDKRRNALMQGNFPITLAPSYSRSDSVKSTRPDLGFGGSTRPKENQSAPPTTSLSPNCASKVRMPFLESQEEWVRQVGYGPPSSLLNNCQGQTSRPTAQHEENAYSTRAGNYPNASKLQDENELYWNRLDLNGQRDTQENTSNSLKAYNTYSSVPFIPQSFVLRQMQQLLALFKQG